MNEQENQEQPELSSEERFKQTVEKLRPYINNLWSGRWKFIIINVVVGVLVVLYLLFLTKPKYTSTVTILPDYGASSSSMLGQLSGLASLAGVSVGTGSQTEIYQNLISSESVLSPVIYAKYKTEEFPDSVNLIEYDKIEPDKNLSLDLQKRKMFLTEYTALLKGKIATDVDRMTKILNITVTMPDAQLSADIANNIARSLDNYIQTQIRSSAKEQRIYIERRLNEVKDSLTMAENNFINFTEANRAISQSPSLQLMQARLQRSIDILNAVYVQLAQQAELAKIQEVKDTPVINIEEFAKNPVDKNGPRRLVTLIIIMFFSVLISATYLIFSLKIKLYYELVKGNNQKSQIKA